MLREAEMQAGAWDRFESRCWGCCARGASEPCRDGRDAVHRVIRPSAISVPPSLQTAGCPKA